MIEHIVLFKVRRGVTAEQTEGMLGALLELKGRVPGLLDASAGANFGDRARGFTHGFVARFADRAALEAYLPHPAHKDVVENHVKPFVEGVLSLDYEIR